MELTGAEIGKYCVFGSEKNPLHPRGWGRLVSIAFLPDETEVAVAWCGTTIEKWRKESIFALFDYPVTAENAFHWMLAEYRRLCREAEE